MTPNLTSDAKPGAVVTFLCGGHAKIVAVDQRGDWTRLTFEDYVEWCPYTAEGAYNGTPLHPLTITAIEPAPMTCEERLDEIAAIPRERLLFGPQWDWVLKALDIAEQKGG